MRWLNRFRSQPPNSTDNRFGFAVVGLGHIATQFMEGLRDSPVCRVSAVVSGNMEKAQRIARKNRAKHAFIYADFDHLATKNDVDAVYLALPVSMHREFTLRAAAAGKHVLCEKPMASTAYEAQEMVEACRAAGVRLSIAYRCPHTPIYQNLRQLIENGRFGEKSSLRFKGQFGFHLKPGWRDRPNLAGGGSLFDIGIYPLNTARFLLGEDPIAVENAQATLDEHGMEREIRWTSVFPSGARADCISSYQKDLPDTLSLSGEAGSVMVDPAFGYKKPLYFQGEISPVQVDSGGDLHAKNGVFASIPHEIGAEKRTPIAERETPFSHFRLEAEELANAVREGRDTITPGEDGLADMVAIEAIYKAKDLQSRFLRFFS